MSKESAVIIVLILTIIFSYLVSSLQCNPPFFSAIYNQNQIPSNYVTVTTCNNLQINATVPVIPISLIGQNLQHFTLSETTIGNEQKPISILVSNSTPIGIYPLSMSFNGSQLVNILFIINGTQQTQQQQNPSNCQLNSNILQYNQIVQQGAQLNERITFNPINCSQNILANAIVTGGIVININGNSIRKPVRLSNIEQNAINIIIDTAGLNSQTYSSQVMIGDYSIPFQIIVTGGTSTSTGFNINNLPSCSLTNNILNLNATYSLVCSNIIPDVTIIPRVDSQYVIGTNVQTSANQFIWQFMPKKFGNTFLYADFYYLGSPVGEPFRQELKIQSGSNVAPGTELELFFLPTLNNMKDKDFASIQIIDNKSKSLVENPQLYINAVSILNQSGKTFFYQFEVKKNYTIRATAPGYVDLIKEIILPEREIIININPSSGDSRTEFNISTEVNATIYINGENKGQSYQGKLRTGDNKIEAFKEGFISSKINLTIAEGLIATLTTEFKKGKKQILSLNENLEWEVLYTDEDGSQSSLISGSGTVAEFEPVDYGSYSLISNNDTIWSYNYESGQGGFSLSSISWKGWGIIVLVIIIIIFSMFKKKNNESNQVPFAGSIAQ